MSGKPGGTYWGCTEACFPPMTLSLGRTRWSPRTVPALKNAQNRGPCRPFVSLTAWTRVTASLSRNRLKRDRRDPCSLWLAFGRAVTSDETTRRQSSCHTNHPPIVEIERLPSRPAIAIYYGICDMHNGLVLLASRPNLFPLVRLMAADRAIGEARVQVAWFLNLQATGVRLSQGIHMTLRPSHTPHLWLIPSSRSRCCCYLVEVIVSSSSPFRSLLNNSTRVEHLCNRREDSY
jgi:hypothetical protein